MEGGAPAPRVVPAPVAALAEVLLAGIDGGEAPIPRVVPAPVADLAEQIHAAIAAGHNPAYAEQLQAAMIAAGRNPAYAEQLQAAMIAAGRNPAYAEQLQAAMIAAGRNPAYAEQLQAAMIAAGRNPAYAEQLQAAMIAAGRNPAYAEQLQAAMIAAGRNPAYAEQLQAAMIAAGRNPALAERIRAAIAGEGDPVLAARVQAAIITACTNNPALAEQLQAAIITACTNNPALAEQLQAAMIAAGDNLPAIEAQLRAAGGGGGPDPDAAAAAQAKADADAAAQAKLEAEAKELAHAQGITKMQAPVGVNTIKAAHMSIQDRFNLIGQAALAAGDEDNSVPKGVWISGVYGTSKQRSMPNNAGYNAIYSGPTIGGDINIDDNNVVGIAYSYILSNYKFKDNLNKKLNAKSNVISLYSHSQINEEIIWDNILSVSFGKVKVKDLGQNPGTSSVVTGKYKNTAYSLDTKLGYRIPNEDKSLSIIPYIGLKVGRSKDSRYTLGKVEVDGKSESPVAGVIGTQIAKKYRISDTTTITPALDLGLQKNFNKKNSTVKAKFVGTNEYFPSQAHKKSKGLEYNITPCSTFFTS